MAINAPQYKFSEHEIIDFLNKRGFQNINKFPSEFGKIQNIEVRWKNLGKSDYKQLFAHKKYIGILNLNLEPKSPDDDDEHSLYELNMNPSGFLPPEYFAVILKKDDGYYYITPQTVQYAAELYYDTTNNIIISQLSLLVTLPPQVGGHRNAFSKSSRRTSRRPSRHRLRRKIKSTLNRSRSSTRSGRSARAAGL